MCEEKYNKIYDILVAYGANVKDRKQFIHAHCVSENTCDEWRFQGIFGFGGKYYRKYNRVDYYSEDETPELNKSLEKINEELQNINI